MSNPKKQTTEIYNILIVEKPRNVNIRIQLKVITSSSMILSDCVVRLVIVNTYGALRNNSISVHQ